MRDPLKNDNLWALLAVLIILGIGLVLALTWTPT